MAVSEVNNEGLLTCKMPLAVYVGCKFTKLTTAAQITMIIGSKYNQRWRK
jgi:hypothetical protein